MLAVVACSALLLVPAVRMSSSARAGGVQFTIGGSTQMFTLGALMANYYQTSYPNTNISVLPSTSQSGFTDSCSTAYAMGMSDSYIQDDQLRGVGCGDMIGVPSRQRGARSV